MNLIDGHCDVLYKIVSEPSIFFQHPSSHSGRKLHLHASDLDCWTATIQNFAIYHDIFDKESLDFHYIRHAIEVFQRAIVRDAGYLHVSKSEDLQQVITQQARGALLSLEGCDFLTDPLVQLTELKQSGISILSLTWNHSNWSGDGTLGSEHGGLTELGIEFVKRCQSLGIVIDVSHLSDSSLAHMFEYSQKPLIATHSNCRSICNHPRNLRDDQIIQLIANSGIIGLNFVPFFVSDQQTAGFEDFRRHVEHICELGGEKHIGLGSDFDGTEQMMHGMANAGCYMTLFEYICKHCGEEIASSLFWRNWHRFLSENLPLN